MFHFACSVLNAAKVFPCRRFSFYAKVFYTLCIVVEYVELYVLHVNALHVGDAMRNTSRGTEAMLVIK